MDRQEVAGDFSQSLIAALQGHQAQVWTALPGIVKSYDPVKMVVSVLPAIQALMRSKEGTESWVTMPVLLDCPVLFQGGGGCALTFPVVVGDECLIIFGSRCIDAWWDQGTVGVQAELRMHDLSDGFALVGVRSRPKAIASPSTNSVQLRSDDGSAFVEINPSTHNVHILTSGDVAVNCDDLTAVASGAAVVTANSITVNGPTTVNGNLQVNGSINATGDVSGNGHNLSTHHHDVANVQGGSSTRSSGGSIG